MKKTLLFKQKLWLLPRFKHLIMGKIVLILFFTGVLQLQANTFAQTVSISKKNISIENVFREIKKQTGYYVISSSENLKNVPALNVEYEDAPLEQILEDLLNPFGLDFKIEGQNIIINLKKNGYSAQKDESPAEIVEGTQQREITGTIKDLDNNPLGSVSVSIKGTAMATASDDNGSYKISGETGDILIFSSIGFLPEEIVIADESSIDVFLESQEAGLDEVIVVGYGTQKKENLTGAVSQINAEDISLRPSTSVATSLQGLMPGLNIQIDNGDPSATPELNVRGFNSINGGSPLVLVDGIEGDIARVNPDDIESVSVLKDAASSAIYGARGSFGVILITTKRGKSGAMKVDYTNNFGWTSPTTRTDFVSDPYVYAKTIDAAIFGYNGSSYAKGFNDMDWEALRMVAAGELDPFHELQSDGSYKFFYNTNWYDYLFKKYQASNIHNIAISGGTDKLKSYLSGRVFNRETINNIAPADVDRYNLKSNLTFVPNTWLELSNDMRFVNEKDEDFGGYRNGYGGIWSTTTWYDLFPFFPNKIDGVPVDVGRDGTGGQGGHAALEEGNNWRRWVRDEFTNTFRAKATPLKGLELNFDYSHRVTYEHRTYRYNEFDMLHTNALTPITTGINRLGEWRWKDRYNALNLYGSYQTSINQDHNFKLLLGYNQEAFDRDRVAAQMNDLLIRDLANLALGTEMYNIDGSAMNWAIQGYFGRFNYDYKNKYLLEVNSRYDGSSRFPSDSRWGFFPSVSAGWQIDREAFWDPLANKISSFKIRASYGKLGNQTVDVNTFKQLMPVGKATWLENGENIIGATAPNPLPKVVTWETTKSTNVGVDVGVLNNRLLASLDLYEKRTEGMYLPGQPLPGVFGANEPRENFAALKNRGFELDLSYRDKFDVAGSPLSFSVSASVSNFIGTIVKYDNPNGLMSTYWEGQRLGEMWGYQIDGQFQSDEEAWDYQQSFQNPTSSLGKVYKFELNTAQNSQWNRLKAGDIKYLDTNGDGKIDKGDYTLENHGDLVPIGNSMPQFPFGFNINASWKNWDMGIAGAGVGKQHWYPTGDIYWGPYQRPYLSFIRKDLVNNAWTPENPENTYPQIYRGYVALNGERSLYEMNDYYLENVAFLRVKNFTLGYTLPQDLTQKAKISRLRVFFSGENLLTWSFGGLTKYIDPEQAGSAVSYSKPGSAVSRADLRDYPMGKTFSFGVNLSL